MYDQDTIEAVAAYVESLHHEITIATSSGDDVTRTAMPDDYAFLIRARFGQPGLGEGV